MGHSKLYQKMLNRKQWKKLRDEQLTEHPLCVRCYADGYTVAAQCVHHIIPVESGLTDAECESLCFSSSNLMSLCNKCHAAIHRAERYNTKEGHKQRTNEDLQRWIDRHSFKKVGNSDNSPSV